MEEPDGATIAGWKAQYGEVFAIGDYVFRALCVGEHSEILRHKDWTAAEAEDYVVMTTILHPDFHEVENKRAGLISSLAEEVLNLSGYGDVGFARKTMDEARERAAQVVNLMKSFIIAGISVYTDEDLDKYTFTQLADKVALAEQILEIRQGQSILQLIDPAEEQAKEQERLAKEAAKRKDGQATSADPIAQRLKSALG